MRCCAVLLDLAIFFSRFLSSRGKVCARFRGDEGGVFIFDDNDTLALVS